MHRRMRGWVAALALAGNVSAAVPTAPPRTELSLPAAGTVSIDAGGQVAGTGPRLLGQSDAAH